jgi:CRISPR-associated protein Csb2
MLAFEVEYLLGRVFAGDFSDRAASEWPPHPARLFSALVAAHFETGATSAGRAALEWLERQGPPHIRAGEAGEATRVTTFVPINYPGAEVPVRRTKQPRELPAQGPSEAVVYFIWPHAQASAEIRGELDGLAERTGYLGKACSFVRMRVTDETLEPNYSPVETGGHSLRVASHGRLLELESLFGAGLRPSFGLQQRYAPSKKQPPGRLWKGFFGETIIFRKTRGPGLPIESALVLSEATRLALLSQAGNVGKIPEILHGHVENGHCAIVSLPFTGSQHADGHLMGLAVLLPKSIDTETRKIILQACRKLKEIHLPAPLGTWQVEMLSEEPLADTLRPTSWTGPAKSWSTVTPVLLDRFPKKKGPSVEEILRTSCQRAGLPEPVSIEHSPFSKLTGVVPVNEFCLTRRKDARPRWGVHATLEFNQEILGPVLVGAGRFFGLGLFKPGQTWERLHDQQ